MIFFILRLVDRFQNQFLSQIGLKLNQFKSNRIKSKPILKEIFFIYNIIKKTNVYLYQLNHEISRNFSKTFLCI